MEKNHSFVVNEITCVRNKQKVHSLRPMKMNLMRAIADRMSDENANTLIHSKIFTNKLHISSILI